jgi:hypothetical protein
MVRALEMSEAPNRERAAHHRHNLKNRRPVLKPIERRQRPGEEQVRFELPTPMSRFSFDSGCGRTGHCSAALSCGVFLPAAPPYY